MRLDLCEARYCTTSQRAAATGNASVVGQRSERPMLMAAPRDAQVPQRTRLAAAPSGLPWRRSVPASTPSHPSIRAGRLNLLQYKCLAAIIGQRCALDCHRAPSIMARCFARASGAPATDASTSNRCDKKLSVNATAARATPIHGNSR